MTNFRIIAGIGLIVLASCQQSNKSDIQTFKSKRPDTSKNTSKPFSSSDMLYVRNDSLYIVTDKHIYRFANDSTINYKNPFQAIYQINNSSIVKSYNLLLNNLVYFATCEDLGTGYRGYLYVLDIKKHKLIYDRSFKHNYLYSSVGIFIIDRHNKKVFSIGKPEWYEKKQTEFTAAACIQ